MFAESHPAVDVTLIQLETSDAYADEKWIAAPLAGLPLGVLRDARGAGFQPRMRFEGDDFRSVLALVANGLGIALMPCLAIQHVPAKVTIRPLTGAPLTRLIYTARLRTRSTPPAVAALETAIRRPLSDDAATLP